ncbi:MAG: aminotransferase class V-fold PLP-dependent enzyme [Eubacteriaceae bacterium]|nr:aminotransferase class V-fold PLP-dependent enzyme [Eubacteriaceae bacterium]
MDRFEEIRKQRQFYPATNGRAYLMSAATGLVGKDIYEAYLKYMDGRYFIGGDAAWGEDGVGTGSMLLRARESIGKMINADGKNICFGDNSSRMLNIFINGITLGKGDNIIIPEDTFISSHMAWKEKQKSEGFEMRFIPMENGEVSADRVIGAADENTKVISICHVENNTGYRHDIIKIGEFCKKNGIILLVDGMQSMGVLRVDVRKMNIDYLIGGDYKWMQGFCGTGYAYISDRCLEILPQPGAGWFGAAEKFGSHDGDIKLSSGADRFEYGYPNAPGIFSLALAAEKYMSLGGENIEDYVLYLADRIREKVRKSSVMKLQYDPSDINRSQIVKIIVENVDECFGEYLTENDVFVNASFEDGKCIIRLSIHYYNNETDIEKFVETVEKYKTAKRR